MTTVPYQPNTPQFPTDSFATSQPQLNRNFQTLFDVFAVNHIPMNDAGEGNHTNIQLVEQASDFQTDISEISVYTKDLEGQTDQIFLRYQGNQDAFQYTNYQIYSIDPTPTQTSYFSFLPGGIIVYFGLFISPGQTPITNKISLFPTVSKHIMSVNLTPTDTSTAAGLNPSSIKLVKSGDFIQYIKLAPQVASFLSSHYYLILGNI